MRKKLLALQIGVVALALLIAALFSWRSLYADLQTRTANETRTQMTLVQGILREAGMDSPEEYLSLVENYGSKINSRITIMDPEGTVLADTHMDYEKMENHRWREEVAAALQGSERTALRYSATLQEYYYYFAAPLEMGEGTGVLRISVPMLQVRGLVWDLLNGVLLGIGVGGAVAMATAWVFTRRFMEPVEELTDTALSITQGNYDEKIRIRRTDEIGVLVDAFNQMTYTLNKNRWQLEERNAELQSVLSSMETGMAAIGGDYRFILHNQNFLRLLGLEETDVTGQEFYAAIRNTDLFSLVEDALDKEDYRNMEITMKSGGPDRILRLTANPIRTTTQGPYPYGVLVMVEDVTQIRKLENIRRDFVSNVTHELRTPLTSIQGFVEALREGAMEDPATARRFLEIIEIEAERLNTLIADILSLGEIETMGREKVLRIIPVEEVAREVMDLLEQKAEDKGIELVLEVQEGVRPYPCNPDRIKQLLINLVDNGIKYTEQGRVTLRLKEGFKALRIEVEDTGIGIGEEHLPRLFERFYRVDRGRSRNMGGTGLGLSIVKHIAELYKGSVRVESTPGKGTTFKVKLPRS
ncbi:HAMP domain-containing sensor histidine kinase [Anaerotalea alkaliphila]|uniref:histidine kinase n=1 Tax=Anaerotalea alkaliphila TaxID=2662126 RepID=A0A7X5HW89_9FIRM|nr:ATP-binding protein [Anaerotalea alkaliphila]NDL67768.1 HAMP domain-containing protein [Anaerotalea alkaliphila]